MLPASQQISGQMDFVGVLGDWMFAIAIASTTVDVHVRRYKVVFTDRFTSDVIASLITFCSVVTN